MPPVGSGPVPQCGPGDSSGTQVGTLPEYLENRLVRLELIDSVEPDAADVFGNVRVVSEELDGGIDDGVRVLVDHGQHPRRRRAPDLLPRTLVEPPVRGGLA